MLKRILTTTLVGATLMSGSMLAGAAVTAAPAGATSCPSGTWNSETLGVPTSARPGMTGVALFRKLDNDVFSLRMSTGRPRAVYTGSISVTEGSISYRAIRTERGDVIRQVSPQKIVFAMTNRGHLDGLDIRVPCSSAVKFGVAVNGHKVATANIVLGAAAVHPASNPFTETKA
jgi:hypothetical protein